MSGRGGRVRAGGSFTRGGGLVRRDNIYHGNRLLVLLRVRTAAHALLPAARALAGLSSRRIRVWLPLFRLWGRRVDFGFGFQYFNRNFNISIEISIFQSKFNVTRLIESIAKRPPALPLYTHLPCSHMLALRSSAINAATNKAINAAIANEART